MNRLFDLLSRYNRREQTILLVGALAVLFYILWMGVVSPLQQKRDQQHLNNAAASAALGRVEMMTLKISALRRQNQHQGSADSGNISQLVDSTLRANGLSMSGFQPGTQGEARVRLDNVDYAALMQWLYDLEYKHDVALRELTLAAGSQPGQTTVTLRLHRTNSR